MPPDRVRARFGFLVAGTAVAIATTTAIGWLDYATGADLSFSLVYLLPVIAAALWLGRTSAVVTALAASAAWFAAEFALIGPTQHGVSAWNGFTRLVIFVFVAVVTAALRSDRQRLRELLAESEITARTDALTGLPNMRAFTASLNEELSRAQREPRSLCVAYVDLDNFKKVNDRYGHADGNQLLADIGAAIRRNLRAGDVPARIGGDEFAALLWNADPEAGQGIAERIVASIEAMRERYAGTDIGASAGVAWFAAPPEDSDTILRAADAAMYEAKAQGKGRVVVHRVT